MVADRVGVLASTACAAHCVILPVLLVAGTTVPAWFLGEEVFHQAILFVVLPAALVAFSLGCRRHKDHWVIGLGSVGLLGIVLAAFLHGPLGESGERILTFGAATLLVLAHVRNYRLCRSANCEHE